MAKSKSCWLIGTATWLTRIIERFENEAYLPVLTPTKKRKSSELTDEHNAFNRMVSSVRTVVEHPFRVIKRQIGFVKVRYGGFAKNMGQFAWANPLMARKLLMHLLYKVRP